MDRVALLRDPVVVHDAASVLHVLKFFKDRPVQMAIVVDEYGVVQGIVTQTNLLEAMAGDIPDEDDHDAVVEREDESLLKEGATPSMSSSASNCPVRPRRARFRRLPGFVCTILAGCPLPVPSSSRKAGGSRSSISMTCGSTR